MRWIDEIVDEAMVQLQGQNQQGGSGEAGSRAGRRAGRETDDGKAQAERRNPPIISHPRLQAIIGSQRIAICFCLLLSFYDFNLVRYSVNLSVFCLSYGHIGAAACCVLCYALVAVA